jgi:hypothetical protein
MVYKIVEIKYTVFHVMQSCTKKANVMYTGQGKKSKFLKISKIVFIFFYLLLVYLCLYLEN